MTFFCEDFSLWEQESTTNETFRVALIVGGFPSEEKSWSGTFNLRAAKGLLEHGIDLIVFQIRTWKPGRPFVQFEHYDNIRVFRVAFPLLPLSSANKYKFSLWINLLSLRIWGWLQLRRWFETCDIIHTIGIFPLGTAGSTWANWAKKDFLAEIIGSDLNVGLTKHWNTAGVRGWNASVSAVSCNSRELARLFLDLYPQQPNVTTIYRGIDIKQFRPVGELAGPLAEQSPVRFLFLGGFPEYKSSVFGSNVKGGRTLQVAWEMAETVLKQLGASLFIGGPYSQTEEILSWRANLKFPEIVHILGPLPSDQIANYLRASDIVLVPSMQEGLPNICVEAGACGRAVFGSDAGGIPEVIVHNETGLILHAGNEVVWKNAFIEYAGKSEKVRAMGLKARKRIETHFDARQYGVETLKLYRQVLAD